MTKREAAVVELDGSGESQLHTKAILRNQKLQSRHTIHKFLLNSKTLFGCGEEAVNRMN
jgi:hypothetical protein